MALLEKHLVIKKSSLPNSGKGLFTNIKIEKGSLIVEYKGVITTWKKIVANNNFNGYVFYVNRNLVIDAKPCKKEKARYANDAKGISKMKNKKNNCFYKIIGKRVYVKSLRSIEAGEELLAGYGKEYWDVVRYNARLK